MLERVSRQVDRPVRYRRAGPRSSADARRCKRRPAPRSDNAARRHRGAVMRCQCGMGAVDRPDPHRPRGKNRLRAELHQHHATQIGESAHTVGESDRLTSVPSPVLRIEVGSARQHLAGAVADERQLRRRIFETACIRLELVEHGVEQRRMERVTGIQPLAADSRFRRRRLPRVPDLRAGPESTVLAPL